MGRTIVVEARFSDRGANDTHTWIVDWGDGTVSDGSFVTGGGWIDSPAGAYQADAEASGRASFGFVSRYKKGASTPDGSTEFRFEAVGLEFLSTGYEWLVVSGDAGRFKGEGTLSGVGNVRFMLWATDGAARSTGEPDTFRVRIWQQDADGAETTLYDNGADQALGGGSIVVHSKNNKK